jgi:plastocyanin
MNPKLYLRDRILAPLLLAILAGLIIITIIINVSRVLLAVGADKGIYVSASIAVAILGTAVWAATRPRLPAHSGMFLLAFAGLASVIAGSISFNKAEPKHAGAAAVPFATEEVVVAQPDAGPLMYDKSTLDATVGPNAPGIRIDLLSGAGDHTFLVEGHESELKLLANPSKPDSGTIVLAAGSYTYYCDIAGHRAAGMFGTMTVVEDPNATPIGGAVGAGGEGTTTTVGAG